MADDFNPVAINALAAQADLAARAKVFGGEDEDPEAGARAIQLSAATGIPPTAIYGDDTFEPRHKAQLAASIVGGNRYLQQYVNSHPLAATVSKDDWGALDKASHSIEQLGHGSILGEALQGFKEGYDPERPVVDYTPRTQDEVDLLLKHPYLFAAGKIATGDVEWLGRVFSGGLGALHGGLKQFLVNSGMDETNAESLSREVTALTEYGAMRPEARPYGPKTIREFQRPLKEAAEGPKPQLPTKQLLKPYLQAGEEPPFGLDIDVDKVHEEQLARDEKNIKKAMSDLQSTGTFASSPEMAGVFSNLFKLDNVEIAADKVRALYGDKTPTPGDGLFGDIPGFAEHLAAAEAIKSGVEVPTNALLKLDPEIFKELQDDIRYRDGGVSRSEVEEAKEAKGEEKEEEQNGKPVFSSEMHGRQEPVNYPGRDITSLRSGTLEEIYNQFLELSGWKPDAVQKALADRVMALVGDYPTHLITRSDMEDLSRDFNYGFTAGGFSDATNGRIVANIENTTLPNYFATMLLHEGAHAFTTKNLRDNPAYEPILRSIIDALRPLDEYSRYGLSDKPGKSGREFFAELYSNKNFRDFLKTVPMSPELKEVFNKYIGELPSRIKSMWDAALDIIRRMLGMDEKSYTALDAAFDIAGRLEEQHIQQFPEKAVRQAASLQSLIVKTGITEGPKQELPEKAGELFGKGTLGQPKSFQDTLLGLIRKENAEDIENQLRKNVKEESKRQTAQWKQDAKTMRGQVEREYNSTPEVAATNIILNKRLLGNAIGKVTLDRASLPKDLAGALPESFFQKTGRKLTLDQLAELAGSPSGRELYERLVDLHTAAGDEPWAKYLNRMIDEQVDKRMKAQYGDLDENILQEAKERAVGKTTMNILHEDTVKIGMLAGHAEMPYTLSQAKGWVKAMIKEFPMYAIKTDRFLQQSGRQGKLIEMALLAKKWAEAFKEAQSRQWNALSAVEAMKVAKERASFERLARLNRGTVDAKSPITGEAADMMHALMIKAGLTVDRPVQQISDSMFGNGWKKNGLWENLQDFVKAAQDRGELGEFPEWIYNAPPKEYVNMTYGEFSQVHDALKSLFNWGKREKKIFVGDREIDRIDGRDRMIGQIRQTGTSRPGPSMTATSAERIKARAKELGISLLQPEFIFDRFDGGDVNGPFTQFMFRQLPDSFNNFARKGKEAGEEFTALADRLGMTNESWHEKLPSIFKNPNSIAGEMVPVTRGDLRTAIFNMGNPTNLRKLLDGWKITQDQLSDWVQRYSTEEDWQWAQGVGRIFEKYGRENQRMWNHVYGYQWDFIDTPPIDTPFGQMEGWYAPLIKHPVYEKEFNSANKIYANDKALFQYVHDRLATPDGHTRDRTQAVYPLSLDPQLVVGRLKTMIYDTEMREAVLNFNSFLKDQEWRNAVKEFAGDHYVKLFEQYIKTVANHTIQDEAMNSGVASLVTTLTRNVVGALINYGIGTPLKHGPTALGLSAHTVGLERFGQAFGDVWLKAGSKDLRDFIYKNSEEIQRRRNRNYQESLYGSFMEATIGESKFRQISRKTGEYGAMPVAFSDRLSSEPTWWAKYSEVMNETGNDGDATFQADRAVRFAHGSTAITSRPAAMNSGPLAKPLFIVYNFFNDIFNRTYKMGWEARDTVKDSYNLFSAGEAQEGITRASKGMASFMATMTAVTLMPAIIEEMVSPSDKDEPFWQRTFKFGVPHVLAGGVPVVRDIVDGLLLGREGQIGGYGAISRIIGDLSRDLGTFVPDELRSKTSKKRARDMEQHLAHTGDYVQHAVTALGLATGIGSRPLGAAAKYWINVGQGNEPAPEGIWEAGVGTRFGTTKKHSKTIGESPLVEPFNFGDEE